MNADSRSACTRIVWYECAIWPELWDQYLNSLQEFILPMDFLKTNHIVVRGKSCKEDLPLVPGKLWKQGIQ